eukprot:XP_001705930.1 Hypothetical protein GL50803_96808 [Giardia lamblia ATCC 50803]
MRHCKGIDEGSINRCVEVETMQKEHSRVLFRRGVHCYAIDLILLLQCFVDSIAHGVIQCFTCILWCACVCLGDCGYRWGFKAFVLVSSVAVRIICRNVH